METKEKKMLDLMELSFGKILKVHSMQLFRIQMRRK